MRSIANVYMERVADVKDAQMKYSLVQDLMSKISEFELMNGVEFMKSMYSRTNGNKNIEVYQMIFFSDIFSLLIKKEYDNNGDIVDCAIMEYYSGDEL